MKRIENFIYRIIKAFKWNFTSQVGVYGHRQMTPVTVNDPSIAKTPQSPHGPHGPREPSGAIFSKATKAPMSTLPTPWNKQRHHLQQLGQRQQEDRLSLTAIFLPVARSSVALPFFEALRTHKLTVRNVSVVAMDLGNYWLFLYSRSTKQWPLISNRVTFVSPKLGFYCTKNKIFIYVPTTFSNLGLARINSCFIFGMGLR